MPKMPTDQKQRERAILGNVFNLGDLDREEASQLRPELFYDHSHALICKAMLAVNALGQEINVLTVADELKRQGHLNHIGGPAFLMGLNVPTEWTDGTNARS